MNRIYFRKNKNSLLLLFIVILIFFQSFNFSIFIGNQECLTNIGELNPKKYEKNTLTSSSNHEEKLAIMLDRKLTDYMNLGYFPQYYEASLQSTYHALYVLDALNRLDLVNASQTIEFIMSHYHPESYSFRDAYSLRYLDYDSSHSYYQLNTLLETTCYGTLSLAILGALDFVNVQGIVTFIWSCLNPEGSVNGFIGQPYNPSLDQHLRNATADNTYFALLALDLLMPSWSSYVAEKARLVSFLNYLQSTKPVAGEFGGFYETSSYFFDALDVYDPSLLSSYYCLESLELLARLDTVRIADFHEFLAQYYRSVEKKFVMDSNYHDKDVLASALGLVISDMTGFTSFDRQSVMDFVVGNRNELGNWDCCTKNPYHELLDVFQIVRALKESGDLDALNDGEKNEVAESLHFYQSGGGFAPLSRDYMSLELLNSVVNAFWLEDRVTDLDILTIYEWISGSYFDFLNHRGFNDSPQLDPDRPWFRSYPLEYYCLRSEVMNETHHTIDHESTFFGLDALLKMSKLDDFDLDHGLSLLMNEIIDSQIVDPSKPYHGAFLANVRYKRFADEVQARQVSLKNSYFALKCLEVMVNYKNLGPVKELPFSWNALYQYISKGMVETDSYVYYCESNSTNKELLLEDTYYTLWILNAIDLLSVNVQKVKNFLEDNLDYANLKVLYLTWKISELLDIDFTFNYEKVDELLDCLYDPVLNEFYLDVQRDKLCQNALYRLEDMAHNDEVEINSECRAEVLLGGVNTITTSLRNLVRTEFGDDVIVVYDTMVLGTIFFDQISVSTFEVNVLIPENSYCYPVVQGDVIVYDNYRVIGQAPLAFSTCFDLNVSELAVNKIGDELHFSLNVSYEFASGNKPAMDSDLKARVEVNDFVMNTLSLTRIDHADYSSFSLEFSPDEDDEYLISFCLEDEFHPEGLVVDQYEIKSEVPKPLDLASLVALLVVLAILFIVLYGSCKVIGALRRKTSSSRAFKTQRVHLKASRMGMTVEDIFSRED